MRKIHLHVLLALALLCFSCKGKKNMSGTDEVSAADFVEFFEPVKLPLVLADTSLKRKANDSLLISHTIFNQFIGDSIFAPIYGEEQPKIYAEGRFRNEEAETYLLLRAKGAKITTYYVVAFTPEDNYSAHLALLTNAPKKNEVDKVTIDPRFTFNMLDQYRTPDGSTNEYTSLWAYNNAGLFMVIMTNGLKNGEQLEIINPIDTLPALNKYSGNYGKDKRNFITIRDGKTPQDFLFFINFDKGAGSECHAELKGEASLLGKDSAVYISPTDPCTIGFKFSGNGIRITEVVNCGNKRPKDCSFNASYNKQKAVVEKKDEKAKV